MGSTTLYRTCDTEHFYLTGHHSLTISGFSFDNPDSVFKSFPLASTSLCDMGLGLVVIFLKNSNGQVLLWQSHNDCILISTYPVHPKSVRTGQDMT